MVGVLKKKEKKKATRWHERNFITEVLLPSLFARKTGTEQRPVFPALREGQVAITWIGHASFLVQTPNHNILIDPNWANWLVVIKRLKRAGLAITDLPDIDLVLITHAHFDHLNRRTLRAIASRQPIVVPSGVANLVHDLGFEHVHEMNWWDEWSYRDLKITFTPAKHWGARVLHDRHRGYGGFVIAYEGRQIYHCGDSAYFSGFREIGRAARAGDRAATHRRVRAAVVSRRAHGPRASRAGFSRAESEDFRANAFWDLSPELRADARAGAEVDAGRQ